MLFNEIETIKYYNKDIQSVYHGDILIWNEYNTQPDFTKVEYLESDGQQLIVFDDLML